MTYSRRRIVMAAGATLMAGTPGRKLLAAGPAQDLTNWTPTEAKPLPEFKWTTADGTVRTMADLAGQGVVLNFWATWCVPCVVEMPALDDLARQMAAENVAILALASDRGGAAVVTKFFQDKGIRTLPVLLDQRGEAARAFGAKGLPTTIVIDRNGMDRGRLEGAVEWASAGSVAALRKVFGAKS